MRKKPARQLPDRYAVGSVPPRIRSTAARLCRSPFPALFRTAPVRTVRLQDLPQTRRPEPYRSAQDQQYDRTDSDRATDGQNPYHRRNGRRAARCGYRYGLRAEKHAVHRLHGQDRRRTSAHECAENENAGRRSAPGHFGQHDAEGRHERGNPRLVLSPDRHALHHRLDGRPSPLPRYGGPATIGHQRGDPQTTAAAGMPRLSGLPDSLCRRRQQCGRNDLPLHRRPAREDRTGRGRWKRRRLGIVGCNHSFRRRGYYSWGQNTGHAERGRTDRRAMFVRCLSPTARYSASRSANRSP